MTPTELVLVLRLPDADDAGGDGDGGFRVIMPLSTVAGLPPFWRSMTIVEPRTSPEDDTAAAPTYRRVVFWLDREMAVSKPWRGDSAMRFVWLLMLL